MMSLASLTMAMVAITTTASPEGFVNAADMWMIPVPAGSFRMGSPVTEPGRESDEAARRVTLTRPFFIARTEVTQGQWRSVMGTDPSQRAGSELPVESVSWFDAVRFCNRLSELDGRSVVYAIDGERVSWDVAANGYRLPTEAEWEFAARGGTGTRFWHGEELDGLYKNEWARDSRGGRGPRPVATAVPNPWGLYDALGNVWEWCWDWFDFYAPGDTLDPRGPEDGRHRVFRGGSAFSAGERCRAAARDRYGPKFRNAGLGLRPVCGGP